MTKISTSVLYAYEQVVRSEFTERVVRRTVEADGYQWNESGVVSFQRRERPTNEAVEYVVFLTAFNVVAVGEADQLDSSLVMALVEDPA